MRISFASITPLSNCARAENGTAPAVPRPRRHRQGGMAVIVMLALLSIVLLLIAANVHSLYSLKREVQLTEQKQARRLAALSAANSADLSARATGTDNTQTNPPAAPLSAPE